MEFTIFPKPKDTKGFVRLYIFESIKNQQGWFPTKVKVLEDTWDQEEQRITKAMKDHSKLNGILTKRKAQLQEAFDQLEYEKVPASVDAVRAKYNAIVNHEITGKEIKKGKKPHIKFLEFMDLYVKERTNMRAKGYLRQFKATRDHVAAVIKDPEFSDINSKFYADLIDYLVEDANNGEGVENNTIYGNVKRICTVMRAGLRDARTKHQDIPLDFEFFDDMYVKPKPFWLDWETDLAKMEKFKSLPEHLPYQQEFLFRCYTGLRHSDLFNATKDTFIEHKGQWFINFMTIKTKVDQNLLLHPKAVKILKAWKGKPPRLWQHDCNEFIKLIARAAKITGSVEKVRYKGSERIVSILPKHEMITTHTARRTFARRWMDNKGDLQYLSLYLGHASTKQTEEYIGWTTPAVNQEMMRVIG